MDPFPICQVFLAVSLNFFAFFCEILKLLTLSKEGGHSIEFRNVSFSYPGQTGYALKNINLTLEPGEKLSVVGENGAGKTTFVEIFKEEILILELLKQAEFAMSNSDARRLIEGGGIKLDGVIVNDLNLSVTYDVVMSRGKNKFVQIHFV